MAGTVQLDRHYPNALPCQYMHDNYLREEHDMIKVSVSTVYSGDIVLGGTADDGYFLEVIDPSGKEIFLESLEADDLREISRAIALLLVNSTTAIPTTTK